jgi:integrase
MRRLPTASWPAGPRRARKDRPLEVSTDLAATTCHFCRSEIGLDKTEDAGGRLEALFVLAFTLGMRPGELRILTWDNLRAERHTWMMPLLRSRDGDTKAPKSRRSLQLPKTAIAALQAHRTRQARERLAAGAM